MVHMAPTFLDHTIKGSHFLCEMSKVRLFTRTPPVVDHWDPRGVVGGGGVKGLMCYVSTPIGAKKRKEKSTP